jgi:hypothetical protein
MPALARGVVAGGPKNKGLCALSGAIRFADLQGLAAAFS